MRIKRIKIRQALAALAALFMLAGGMPASVSASVPINEAEAPTQTADETPAFRAYIDYSPQGYVVYGEAEKLPPDTCRIQNLYSLDGSNYQIYHREWDIPASVTSGSAIRPTQICLHGSDEPLRSYLAGTLDRFYLKLLITRENGMTCESEAAVIERDSEPQPIPDNLTPIARFPSTMRVRSSSGFIGKYQLTVRDTATAEEISAYLPDTLPIEVQLGNGICVADCPVTWKPLALSGLIAGESVTITDAAEAIEVPGGTLLNTPFGVFRLEEPLSLDQEPWYTDEVQLVLNAVSADEGPTGVLAVDMGALKVSFDRKPTGATAIRAYTLAEGEAAWTEIQGLALLEAVNAQPSTANSGYATVLDNNTEQFCSYLEAEADGSAIPFFVALKIEGGVYDGKQLVLAWPDTYELPPSLPAIGSGSGGNEDNAGSNNNADSTEEGQRPNLPQQPDDGTDQTQGGGNGQTADSSQPSENITNLPDDNEYLPESGNNLPDGNENPPESGGNLSDEDGSEQTIDAAQPTVDSTDPSKNDGNGSTLNITQQTENASNLPGSDGTGQRPNLPHQTENPENTAKNDTAVGADPSDSDENGHLQALGLSLSPATGFTSGSGTIRMKKPVGSSMGLLAVAGTAGIAGVCSAVSCRAALIRFFRKIIGKIRTILHSAAE